jgi:hypothetical protein
MVKVRVQINAIISFLITRNIYLLFLVQPNVHFWLFMKFKKCILFYIISFLALFTCQVISMLMARHNDIFCLGRNSNNCSKTTFRFINIANGFSKVPV